MHARTPILSARRFVAICAIGALLVWLDYVNYLHASDRVSYGCLVSLFPVSHLIERLIDKDADDWIGKYNFCALLFGQWVAYASLLSYRWKSWRVVLSILLLAHVALVIWEFFVLDQRLIFQ